MASIFNKYIESLERKDIDAEIDIFKFNSQEEFNNFIISKRAEIEHTASDDLRLPDVIKRLSWTVISEKDPAPIRLIVFDLFDRAESALQNPHELKKFKSQYKVMAKYLSDHKEEIYEAMRYAIYNFGVFRQNLLLESRRRYNELPKYMDDTNSIVSSVQYITRIYKMYQNFINSNSIDSFVSTVNDVYESETNESYVQHPSVIPSEVDKMQKEFMNSIENHSTREDEIDQNIAADSKVI